MEFIRVVEQYNRHCCYMCKGYRLRYDNEGNFEYVSIVLSNSNGIESYVINLRDEEEKFLIDYFNESGWELHFNNTGSTFWGRKIENK